MVEEEVEGVVETKVDGDMSGCSGVKGGKSQVTLG